MGCLTKSIIGILITTMGFSQTGEVFGYVKDGDNNQPIQYASVSIVRVSDNKIGTGRITNEKGYYLIQDIPEGFYRMEIEFIGFETFVSKQFQLQENDELNMEIVELELKVLKGTKVDVSVERPLYQVDVDKKVYNIEQLKTTAGGTCCDVLKKIPSLDVGVDGTVSLRGTSNVTILIDEKRAGMLGGERKTNAVAIPVPASTIDRIEIITSPSAKYDPDGMSGIVNIILKDEKKNGYNSEVSLNAGHTGKLTSSALLNYRVKNLNIYAKSNIDIVQKSGNGKRNISLLDSNDVSIYKSDEVNNTNSQQSINFLNTGLKYFFTKNSQLTIDAKITRSSKRLNDSTYYNLNGFQPNKSIEKNDTNQGLNRSYLIGYSYQNSTNSYFNAELVYDISDQQSNQDYLLNSVSDRSIESYQSKRYSVVKIDHFNSLSDNLVMESGYKGRFLSIIKEYGIIPDKYQFEYEENIYALYSTLNYTFSKKLSIKPGLRFEWVNSIIESSLKDSVGGSGIFSFQTGTTKNYYNQIFPTINASYKLNAFSNMQFGYGRRVNRPEFNALDPFPKHFFYSSIDTIGNPKLKPEFINAYEIGYSSINNKIKINTSVYYHSIHDLILWDEGLVSDSLSLYSFENYGNGTLVGAEFNIKIFPMSNWEMSLTVNPFRYDVYADNNESEFYKGTIWNVVKTLTLDRIGKIEMNGSYHSPHTLSTGSIWPNGKINLDFAIQQTFFSEKMTVTLKVTDALNKDHYERIINKFDQKLRVQSHIDTFRKQDDPTLYLAFQYKFGTI